MAKEEIKVAMGLDVGPFKRGLDKVQTGTKSALNNLNSIASGPLGRLAGIFGVGLSAGAIAASTKALAEFADKLDAISKNSGISLEKLQGFRHMVLTNGASAEDAEASIQRFNRRLGAAGNAAEGATTPFAKWGVAIKSANGNLRSTEDVLGDTLDLIKATSDPATRSAIAFDVFGDSGFKMIQALKQGGKALDDMTAKLVEQGRVIRKENVAALVEMKTALDEMFETVQAKSGNAAGKLARMAFGVGAVLKEIKNSGPGKVFGDLVDLPPEIKGFTAIIDGLASIGTREIDTSDALGRLVSKKDRENAEAVEKAMNRLARVTKEFRDANTTSEQKLVALKAQRVLLEQKFLTTTVGTLEHTQTLASLKEKDLELSKQQAAVEKEREQMTQRRADVERGLMNAKNKLLDRGRLTKDQLREFDLSKVEDPAMRQKIAAQKANLLLADRFRNQAAIALQRGQFGQASGLNIQADRREMNLTLIKSLERNQNSQFLDAFKRIGELEFSIRKLAARADGEDGGLRIAIPVVQ